MGFNYFFIKYDNYLNFGTLASIEKTMQQNHNSSAKYELSSYVNGIKILRMTTQNVYHALNHIMGMKYLNNRFSNPSKENLDYVLLFQNCKYNY